jgi:ATP-dependent Clp protease, protease subunit
MQHTGDRRSMTLEERLADERVLFLWGEINSKSAGTLIMRLLEMQAKDATKHVTIYIFSGGGHVDATLAIYDTIRFLKCDVHTICMGQACSGAALILLAGTKGKRFALPHCKIMLHQPSGGVTGQAADIKIQAEEIVKDKALLNDIVAKHTGQTAKKIKAALERDYFMTPTEAIEFGVIDEIITGEDA